MTERDRELLERYAKPETQKALDTIETADARALISQLENVGWNSPAAITIVKGWLRTHWSNGWQAAGGPSGAPEPQKRARKAPQ